MEFEPIAYDYEGDYICPLCRESLPDTEDAEPINSFSYSEVASDTGHGIKCSECEAVLLEGWCEAADTGNEGNGFCSDCIHLGNATLEDQYEDS